MKIFTIGKQIGVGDFVLYRQKSATDSALTAARVQSPLGATVALSDVTGITPGVSGGRPRIVCGQVKWHDVSRLKIITATEDALLDAPTVAGARK